MAELEVSNVAVLKRAIETLLSIDREATVIYSSDGLSLSAMDQNRPILCVLRITPSDLTFFRCDVDQYAGIDLSQLMHPLFDHGSQSSVRIHADEGSDDVALLAQNNSTGQITYSEMSLIEPNDSHLTLDTSQYQYDRVVGIPSRIFRRTIRRLTGLSSSGVIVLVTMSDERVKFSRKRGRPIILHKDNGECITGGFEPGQQEHLMINLHHRKALSLASFMSPSVWMLHSDVSPGMVNFPCASLGNVMFFSSDKKIEVSFIWEKHYISRG